MQDYNSTRCFTSVKVAIVFISSLDKKVCLLKTNNVALRSPVLGYVNRYRQHPYVSFASLISYQL